MSNYYAPCLYRIDFVVIPSYIELPWLELLLCPRLSFTSPLSNFKKIPYSQFLVQVLIRYEK